MARSKTLPRWLAGAITYQGWRQRAACLGVDPHVFISQDHGSGEVSPEPTVPSARAKAYCEQCPVVQECLAYAIATRSVGVWGGLTDHQRAQLVRGRPRKRCPRCSANELIEVVESAHQVCRSCGMSWRTSLLSEEVSA